MHVLQRPVEITVKSCLIECLSNWSGLPQTADKCRTRHILHWDGDWLIGNPHRTGSPENVLRTRSGVVIDVQILAYHYTPALAGERVGVRAERVEG